MSWLGPTAKDVLPSLIVNNAAKLILKPVPFAALATGSTALDVPRAPLFAEDASAPLPALPAFLAIPYPVVSLKEHV